jgi:hypothetical protein
VSSPLESSVTLDDVFVVVGAKRVPLAPELAGYLALEIAEGATQAIGDIDPRSVYIGEEGSVALVVRPRREPPTGDAEASIRAILARLLDASGSQTPALASVARRSSSAGLNALVEELEAALIPVNRAAGRRALARLAREVKRVTLGVGRNASLAPGEPAPRKSSSPTHTAAREGAGRAAPEEPRPLPRSGFSEEPPTTARRDVLPDPMAFRPPDPQARGASDAPVTRSTAPDTSDLPTVELRNSQITATLEGRSPAAPPSVRPHTGDEVDHLLASFGVSSRGEQAQRNDLKALVGLEPTPPPPEHVRSTAPRSASGSDVESLLAISEGSAPVAPRSPLGERAGAEANPPAPPGLASPPTAISPTLAREPVGSAGRAPSGPIAAASPASGPSRSASRTGPEMAAREPSQPRGLPTAPSARRLAEMGSRPSYSQVTRSPDRSLTILALVVLVLGGGAIWLLRPALFGGPEPRPAPSTLAGAASTATPAPAPRCHASIVVNDAPSGAEILLRAGQAPVDVEKMPVGARLEFVATAEGYAPKRAVVPAGATWDTAPDGKPRYEVAVQLDHSRARAGAVDPWPAGEPGSEVGGKGSPGTVHLVTTPRGAEVWFLAGLGPRTEIDQLKCGGDVEILVAGPTSLRKRLHVAESDFVTIDGGADRQAQVSANVANAANAR